MNLIEEKYFRLKKKYIACLNKFIFWLNQDNSF